MKCYFFCVAAERQLFLAVHVLPVPDPHDVNYKDVVVDGIEDTIAALAYSVLF